MNIRPVHPSILPAVPRLPWLRLGIAAVLAAGLASASPALAVIEYDPSFSEDGLASIDPSTSTDSARDAAVDKGGRVVLTGLSRLGTLASSIDRLVVARLLEDGSPDTDFGDAGVVTFLPDTPNTFGGADGRGVIIQPEDQKIVVAGAWNRNDGSGFQALVARFLENGDPDPDFGDAGSVLLDLPGLFHTVAEDVAVMKDGSLLVAGSCNTSGCTKGFVVKLTPEGKLDETWGTTASSPCRTRCSPALRSPCTRCVPSATPARSWSEAART